MGGQNGSGTPAAAGPGVHVVLRVEHAQPAVSVQAFPDGEAALLHQLQQNAAADPTQIPRDNLVIVSRLSSCIQEMPLQSIRGGGGKCQANTKNFFQAVGKRCGCIK